MNSEDTTVLLEKHFMHEPAVLGQLERQYEERAVCLCCGGRVDSVFSGLFDNRFGSPGSYGIKRCSSCGLERIFPVPTLEELKMLYESHYNFGGETGTLYISLREWFFRSSLYRVWIFIDGDISFHAKKGAGRLLDIGCNEGRGLSIYQRNGFQVEGLEINERAALRAERRGFVVHRCLLEQLEHSPVYDAAVLSNVLEHAVDPVRMLRDLHTILAPGGQVWISCPNANSWLRPAFGKSWINWHVPFHITHFSADTLKRLLEANGYREVVVQNATPALWVAHSVITYFLSAEGKKNRSLRNPVLVLFFIAMARLILFPALWMGNKLGRGDCLLVTATRDEGLDAGRQ